MKTLTLKSIFTVLLSLVLTVPALPQKGIEDGSKYGHGQDSINCLMNLSLYKEFFKHNNYADAIKSWRQVFAECPVSSQNMYIDGVKMYKSFISKEKNPEVLEGYIDTLMLIYDRRMQYFNDEANVLGRKATDLLRYRKDDLKAIEESYGYLKKSIELDNDEARDAVIILFINASVSLFRAGVFDQNVPISDYFMASEVIDMQLGNNSRSRRWLNARETIDEFMLEQNILDCEALNEFFGPKFDENSGDEAFLNKMISFYYNAGCDRSDMYAAASEKLYEINPSSASAYNLARLFVAKELYDKATLYYLEATQGEADNASKATYYYELALVTNVLKDPCQAIKFAREAIKLNPDYGEAYMLLGDSYIASRTNLGEDFQQRTAFWAAVDKYIQAKNVDPKLTDDANKKINDYSGLYPDGEACFFRDLKEGDSYRVEGCINEYTTVRPR
jgi:tetratricopeptide (TPR) repeat protein